MNNQNLIEAALDYAERGWPVFPCRFNQKIPATAHGFKDATTDPAKLSGWFVNARNNLGIATGNGLLVLDLDTKGEHNGLDAVKTLEAQHGELPPTLTARTPSGGEHRLYSYPRGQRIKSNSNKVAPGVDIRADGGYIVASPSQLANGRYEWVSDHYVAELPKAWLELLTQEKPRSKAQSDTKSTIDFSSDDQLEELQSALLHIDANDYDQWTRIGMALYSLGESGFILWDTWSRNSDKYDAKGMRRKFDSFKHSKVAPATVFYLAQQQGWNNPKKKTTVRELSPAQEEPEAEWEEQGDDDAIHMSAAELALFIAHKTQRSRFPFIYDQCIWWAINSGKDEDPIKVERLSNCLPEFVYFQKDQVTGDSSYYMQVMRKGSKRIYRESIEASSTTSADSFKNALRRIGAGLTWSGNTIQLDRFQQEYWFHDPNPNEVETIPYIGYNRENKAYIFTQHAVVNGEYMAVNEQDFFNLDNGKQIKTSFRADAVLIGDPKKHQGGQLWLDDFRLAFGVKGLVSLAFWVGSYFAEQLRAQHGRYPFLEMSGEPGTGKSSIIEFLWRLSGRDNYEGIDPTKASGPGRYRTFEQVANLPLVLMEGDRTDERGHQKSGTGLSEYKGLYNGRGMRVTGKRTGGTETHEPPFRGSLCFAQNTPIHLEDKAMMERIVQVVWDKSHHTSNGYYAELRLRALEVEQTASFISFCLCNEKRFLEATEQGYQFAKQRLESKDQCHNERIRHNHAQLMALAHALKGADILPGLLPADLEAVDKHLEDLCIQRHAMMESDSVVVNEFWDMVHFLEIQNGKQVNHSKNKTLIAINIPWLLREAVEEKQRLPDSHTLTKELKTSRRFKYVAYKTVKSGITGKNVACFVFEAGEHGLVG